MWGEVIVAVLGLLATGATWYFKKKQAEPVDRALSAAKETNSRLLAKYAAAVKRIDQLEKTLRRVEKEAYENYTMDDLIDLANARVSEDDDDPN